MTEKTEDLIREARRQVGHIEDKSMRERLISDLADTLEAAEARLAALTTPQEGDARKRIVQTALAHVPVLGVTGRVVGCRCMDRVFVQHRETWAEHVADAILAAFPVLSRATAPDEAEKVKQMVRDLIDPDDCWFDHHGGCQTHVYLSLKPGELCPHAEAKQWLAALPVGGENDGA